MSDALIEQMNKLSKKCNAISYAQRLLFLTLLTAEPGLKPVFSDTLSYTLDNFECTDKDFEFFVKTELSHVLKMLQAPPDTPHLRLLSLEDDRED